MGKFTHNLHLYIFTSLLFASLNAYATCIPNILNSSTITITSSDSATVGLQSTSAGDCVSNTGSISINRPSVSSRGILLTSSSSDSSVINSGDINTQSNSSIGISIESNNASVVNTGTITTSGAGSNGISSNGSNSNINNSNAITTSGAGAHAINSSGSAALITNSGTITTSGSSVRSITSSGSDVEITNSGTISNSGGTGSANRAISASGSSALVINSGTVSMQGNSTIGVSFFSSSAEFINSGLVTTSGTSSQALSLFSLATSAVINNSGTLITSGSSAHAVSIESESVIFNNSGSVLTSGANANSFNITGNNNTLNLNTGSRIIGNISAGSSTTGNQLNINLGSGASYAYSISGPWSVTDLDNRPMVTGSAYAAGIGAQETASEMLYQRTRQITSALDRRSRSYNSNYLIDQPYWLDVYYLDGTRNSGGNYSTRTAFSNHNYGLSVGFKLPTQFTPLELIVNVEQSNLNIDNGNQKINSSSIMTGLLASNIKDILGAKISFRALLSFADHDGDRKVMTNSQLYNGSHQIKSNYKSNSGLLGASLIKTFDITDHLIADVLVGADLTAQRTGSYRESDYFAWDNRTITQLQSRVQLGLEGFFFNNKGSVFARVGAEYRDLISGAIQDYDINATRVTFNTNNNNDAYLTTQIGTKIQLDKRIQVFAVINSIHSKDNVNSVSSNIGFRADF